MCPSSRQLKVSALGLVALDRFEKRLEITLAERLAAATLNDPEKERRPVLDRLREELEHVRLVVDIDGDVQPLDLPDRLLDITDALEQIDVIALRNADELP